MIQQAAVLYVGFIAALIVFQFCLIFGAPWGPVTQGGRHQGALPLSGRVLAGLSVLLLIMMGGALLSIAGMMPNWPKWTAYVALGIQFLSTLLNWITPSRPERLLWGPITSLMLALAGYLVFAG